MSDNEKLQRAIDLYRTTDLSRKEICLKCGISGSQFNNCLQRHHRDLLYSKNHISLDESHDSSTKLRQDIGQTLQSSTKYNDALKACQDIQYIRYTISDIARLFKVSPAGLSNQLRAHFQNILDWRRTEQHRRGVATFQHKIHTINQYEKAVALFKNTDYTLKEVAKLCEVSYSGLREHVRFNHRNLIILKRLKRKSNKNQNSIGQRTGSNTLHIPNDKIVKKYETALDLYKTSSLSLVKIAEQTHVSYGGLYQYIRRWHKDVLLKRKKISVK